MAKSAHLYPSPCCHGAAHRLSVIAKLPARSRALISILALHPQGLTTRTLAELSMGSVRHSRNEAVLLEARIAALKKQIQRTRQLLVRINSGILVRYERQEKLWHIVHETTSNGQGQTTFSLQ